MEFRNVGAVDVTEFAVEAFIDDLVLLIGSELLRVLVVVLIDKVKKSWE